MTRKQLIAAINREKKALTKSRDNLRNLVEEIGMLGDNSEDALRALEDAADALSQNL